MFNWLKARRNPKKALARIIGKYELPSFPVIVLQALRLLRDPKSSLSDIAAQIEKDPAATAQILRITNSASRGLGRAVGNLDHALSLLGRAEVESLLLSAAVGSSLPVCNVPGLEPLRYWTAAARRATTARRLAALLQPPLKGESFTASLLQDMAIPVLAEIHGAPYCELLNEWREQGGDLSALERERFEWDHAYAGALMAVQWEFPPVLVESIRDHHLSSEPLAAAALVAHLSDAERPSTARLFHEASERHQLGINHVEALLLESFGEAAEIARLFAAG